MIKKLLRRLKKGFVRVAVVGGVITLIFALAIILPLGKHAAHAFNLWTQTDWTGGVGTDPTTQYESSVYVDTSSNGQLTLNGNYPGYWCNNAHCDSNWGKQRYVAIKNDSGSLQTDYQVRLTINYDSDMNSDFSDLRFTMFTIESTNLPYWIQSKTDGVSATVWVKIDSLNEGTSYLSMYYGNPSATSESDSSVVDFYDNFASGSVIDTNIWTEPPAYSISNDVLHLGINTGDDSFHSVATFDHSTDRVLQFDHKITTADLCAGTDGALDFGGFNVNVMYAHAGNNCSDGKYSFHITSDGNGYDPPTEFMTGTAYTFRVVSYASGGDDYYYSTDGGKTFTQFSDYVRGSSTTNDSLIIYTGAVEQEYSHMTVTHYGGNISIGEFGIERQRGGQFGFITSAIFDAGTNDILGNLNYTTSGTGDVAVFLRGSNSPDMSDATDWGLCIGVDNHSSATNTCLHNTQRYIQYMIQLSAAASNDLQFNSFNLEYQDDNTPPPTNASNIIMSRSNGGSNITEGSWTNATYPYFSWTAGADEPFGSGIKGYCLYLGTDNSADLTTTAGVLVVGQSLYPLDTGGQCVAAVDTTHLDLAISYFSNLDSGNTYYLKVKAIDNMNQLYAGDAAQFSFRYDNNDPTVQTSVSAPSVTNSKIFTTTWVTSFPAQIYDNESGLAGIKYCLTNFDLAFGHGDDCGAFSGHPELNHHWYGANHGSGDLTDTSDVLPNSGTFTTSAFDADRLEDNQLNIVFLIAIDNAGNYKIMGQGFNFVRISTVDPTAPQNLQVNPTSNTTNAFSFTWDAPSSFSGSENLINYCWSVNVAIAADASNCNWTGEGITQLATGPFATQQGTNTMYVMAKDQAGNFSSSAAASVDFSASTTAPGTPRNLDITDISTRATSTWKLALSWATPTQVGAGIDHYSIFRSTDNSSFEQVGTTSSSNESFIDSGLSQTTYYYYVKACDNANSCSVPTSTVSKLPTGRFTSPAHLTADTDQPKQRDISTRKATIFWFTDRNSDSKVAFGTSSGHYNPEEIGNTSQTANHVVNLTNLQPGTKYYYVARWTDQDGNTGTSQERSFSTDPAPTISEISETNIGVSSATINFKEKGASQVKLYYGKSEGFGELKSLNTSSATSIYSINLSELNDGSKYFFKLDGIDGDGNEYQGDIISFTTLARPKISNLRFQPITGEPTSTQKVSWTTNVPATSQITYGLKGSPQTSVIDSTLTVEHEITIRNLTDNTEYTLVAQSRDAAGDNAVSDTQTFKTDLDTRPPKISNVSTEVSIKGTGAEARGQLVVSWKTDEPATSQVIFGQGQTGGYNSRSVEDSRLTTEHTVVVSDLPTSSIYHLEALSKDKAQNQGISENQSAIIGRGSDNVFTIIFNALQKIFGL